MKTPILQYLLCLSVCLLCCSCSSDGSTGEPAAPNLVGRWELSDAVFEEESSIDAVVAAELFAELEGQNCQLVVFNFNPDGSGTAESKIEFLDINADIGNFEADCPMSAAVEEFNWLLEEDLLTVTDSEGIETSVTIVLTAQAFTISGEQIDPDTFAGSVAVFTRIQD